MKAFARKTGRQVGDFYQSTLAPLGRRGDRRFGLLDITLLTVLFLEAAISIRLILAN